MACAVVHIRVIDHLIFLVGLLDVHAVLTELNSMREAVDLHGDGIIVHEFLVEVLAHVCGVVGALERIVLDAVEQRLANLLDVVGADVLLASYIGDDVLDGIYCAVLACLVASVSSLWLVILTLHTSMRLSATCIFLCLNL